MVGANAGDAKRQILNTLRDLIVKISDIDIVKKIVAKGLRSNIDPGDFVAALREALEDVGTKYESGEYFLSELIMAGVLSTEVTHMLRPYLTKTGLKPLARVAIGTVRGDVHDIGKNIVIMMLFAAGCEVIDLGVDVPADKFVEVVEKEMPDVLGLSALLSSSMYEMEHVLDVLQKRGLRNRVKVIVGGRPVTAEYCESIGADGYAEDAHQTVGVVTKLMNIEK